MCGGKRGKSEQSSSLWEEEEVEEAVEDPTGPTKTKTVKIRRKKRKVTKEQRTASGETVASATVKAKSGLGKSDTLANHPVDGLSHSAFMAGDAKAKAA